MKYSFRVRPVPGEDYWETWPEWSRRRRVETAMRRVRRRASRRQRISRAGAR